MNYKNIITIEPRKRGGKSCIRNMRITVGDILGWLASGMSIAEILGFSWIRRKRYLCCFKLCGWQRKQDISDSRMKFLFDQNISYRIIRQLPDKFKGSTHIKLEKLINAPDRKIWEFAKQNDFIIVTQDSDFNDLNSLYGFPPKVIYRQPCFRQDSGCFIRQNSGCKATGWTIADGNYRSSSSNCSTSKQKSPFRYYHCSQRIKLIIWKYK